MVIKSTIQNELSSKTIYMAIVPFFLRLIVYVIRLATELQTIIQTDTPLTYFQAVIGIVKSSKESRSNTLYIEGIGRYVICVALFQKLPSHPSNPDVRVIEGISTAGGFFRNDIRNLCRSVSLVEGVLSILWYSITVSLPSYDMTK